MLSTGETLLLQPMLPGTLGDALEAVYREFDAAPLFYGHGTDNAWDEAVYLVLNACSLPPDAGQEALALAITPDNWSTIREWVTRRIADRTPLCYLTGTAWFAGLEFLCDERALVPRSPLAEVILDDFKPWWTGDAGGPVRLLDMCCGGGAIGIGAAVHHPQLLAVLADVDARALALARENRARFGLEQRVTLQESDGFADLEPQVYDIILCNPPYVNARDLADMPDEYRAEPPLGLGSGPDGLELPRRLLREAPDFLAPDGVMFIELGNSWESLDRELAGLAVSWLEFRSGGHGVLALAAPELRRVAAALA